MENKESFTFTYSAAQRQEVENIRSKYLPREENKLERLRRLHRSAEQKAQAWAIGLGTLGALILGTGMSLVMTELGEALALPGTTSIAIGVAVGLVGMVLVALAYPLYNRILRKTREQIAPEILRLTDELLN